MRRLTYVFLAVVLVALMVVPGAAAKAPKAPKPKTPEVIVSGSLDIPSTTLQNPCIPANPLTIVGTVNLSAKVKLPENSQNAKFAKPDKGGKGGKGKRNQGTILTGKLVARTAGLTATDPVSGTVYSGEGEANFDLGKLQATTLPVTIPSLVLQFDLSSDTSNNEGDSEDKEQTQGDNEDENQDQSGDQGLDLRGTLTLTNVQVTETGISADPITAESIVLTCPPQDNGDDGDNNDEQD